MNVMVWHEDDCKHVTVKSPTLNRMLSFYINPTTFDWVVLRHETFTPSGQIALRMVVKYYASFDEAKREFDRYSPKAGY